MPKISALSYDLSLMYSDRPGGVGAHREEMTELFRLLDGVRKTLAAQKEAGKPGFLTIPDRRGEARAAESLAAAVAKKFKTLVVIGIGGSDLGARALVRALKPADKGMDI